MSESFDVSETQREIGQRGPDKQPREFNPKSLSNLKQYQITENIQTRITWNYLIIAVFALFLGVIIWKFYNNKNSYHK